MTNNYLIKTLSIEDMDQVARIHVQAFPESTLSHFGKTLVKRYYCLNMSEPNECYAIGVFSEFGLMGFCFAGVFRDVKIYLSTSELVFTINQAINKTLVAL